jgi:hypothetical protein
VPRARREAGAVVLSRLIGVALAALLLLPATAMADGTFSFDGRTLVFSGDPGDDDIAGFETADSIRFTRFGGANLGGGDPCILSPDQQSIDCPKADLDSVRLDLGAGNDVAAVSLSATIPVRFEGGAGNDGLFGGGGIDVFDGGSGDDNIISRDNHAEEVNCGLDHDTAISDDGDTRESCEEIEGDADGDGVRRPADCNDTNPAIRPGAADTPDDGIDQDCSGADATNLDVDGDGSPRPLDCDDANPAIHPGAREIVGNLVDENCDTDVVGFRGLGGVVRNLWVPSGARTLNRTLTADDLPRGTKIDLRCSGGGCRFRRVVRQVKNSRPVKLHRFFGTRALARGARVELRLTRAGRIGRVLSFKMTSTPGVPNVDFRCKPPGRRIRDC